MVSLKGAVGILILISFPLAGVLVGRFMWTPLQLYSKLYQSGLSEFIIYLIQLGPSYAMIITGLGLYIAGRKEFWKSLNEDQIRIISVLLVVIGLFLSIIGSLFSWGIYCLPEYYARKGITTPYNQFLITDSPIIVFYILWFVSGVVLLVDSIKQLIRLKRS